MPRPVEGFLANDGTFFEDEQQCEIYEATKYIYEELRKCHFVRHFDLEGGALDFFVTEVVTFINDNSPGIQRYIESGGPLVTVEEANPLHGEVLAVHIRGYKPGKEEENTTKPVETSSSDAPSTEPSSSGDEQDTKTSVKEGTNKRGQKR